MIGSDPQLLTISQFGTSSDLVDQVEALRRRYHESVSQLASLTGRLRELAMIDSLTGVLNRRAFLDYGEEEWARYRRHGQPLSCAMIDVDNFKAINDAYGHGGGDIVLRHVSSLIRASLRPNDLPARLGGDEFIALLPETTVDLATATSSTLLARVTAAPVPIDERAARVTLSIGVASAEGADSLDELRERADKALYEAKRHGRNRVWTLRTAPR